MKMIGTKQASVNPSDNSKTYSEYVQAGDVVWSVECLFNMYKALGSIPSTV